VVVPGRASAYSGTSATGFRNDHPFTRVIGSGGLLTTVGDFLTWESALQRGAGPWGAVRDSLERAMRLNDGTELTYALGVGVSRWRGVRTVSHTGSTGGYRAALQRFPDQNVAVALLCNLGSINPGAVANRVAAVVLGSALAAVPAEPAPAAVDPAQLAALAGAWHAPRTEQVLVLTASGGTLVDSTGGGAVLIPLGGGKFKYRGGERILSVAPVEADPARLTLEAPNTRPAEYVRMPRSVPDAATLSAYAGDFRSRELDATLRLGVSRDTLRLERGWQNPIVLTPLYRDGFAAGNLGLIRFERDSRGRVSGLVLWAGRVRHLRFDRLARP
jgi:hypothetical protein